jgi:ferredoxin
VKLVIDPTLCERYGTCTRAAPGLLRLDPSGAVQPVRADVPDDQLLDARAAVRVCPVDALSIDSEPT